MVNFLQYLSNASLIIRSFYQKMPDNNSKNTVDLQKWTPRIENSVTNNVAAKTIALPRSMLPKMIVTSKLHHLTQSELSNS